MSTATPKPTVAINHGRLNEIDEKLDAKAENMGALKKQIEQQAALIATLTDTINDLRNSLAGANNVKSADIIEVVFVPGADSVVPPDNLYYQGIRYSAEVSDGFHHFKVPQPFALQLLFDTTTSNRFVLVGRTEPLKVTRRVGVDDRVDVVIPKTLDKTTNGKYFWKDIVVEESKD